MILLIDHYDSFAYNLYQLLADAHSVRVVRSDAIGVAEIGAGNYEAVVLSPGPGRPEETGVTLSLLSASWAARLPVIGVCLGFQALGLAWGGRVGPAPEVVHGKTLNLTPREHELFAGLSRPLKVGRYHSLAVEAASLPPVVELLAEHQGMAMMALDRARPWAGMQFHPESFLTPEGPKLMRRLLAFLEKRALGDR